LQELESQDGVNAWSTDHAYSIGHSVSDGSHSVVQFLDAEEYPSIEKAVDALNVGKIICPDGLCVVRSERQKLYFLVSRHDMLDRCANLASDVFNINICEHDLANTDPVLSAAQDDLEALPSQQRDEKSPETQEAVVEQRRPKETEDHLSDSHVLSEPEGEAEAGQDIRSRADKAVLPGQALLKRFALPGRLGVRGSLRDDSSDSD